MFGQSLTISLKSKYINGFWLAGCVSTEILLNTVSDDQATDKITLMFKPKANQPHQFQGGMTYSEISFLSI